MINKLYYYISDSYLPYYNQAIEEYLLNQVDSNSLILYLWQNQNTVFIGKNQNAYNEVNIKLLNENNGYLCRRISGGGAVYHDLGNLNFTFIMHKDNYDLDKQNDIILNALKKFNIDAYKSGRNDLLINDKKFSGHAYYKSKDNYFHHGTLMINVDEEDLSKYLNVSLLKLKDKKVKSVKSRIINLKSINDKIDINSLENALIDSIKEIYKLDINEINKEEFDFEIIKELENKFKDPNWLYDKEKKYDYLKEKKYPWGLVKLEYDMKDNIIEDIIIYTDSLEIDIIERLIEELKGKNIKEFKYSNEIEKDIIDLILEDQNEI